MAMYHIYYGDNAGNVSSDDDIEAADDQAAITDAVTKGNSLVVEVWQYDRLVLKHPSEVKLTDGKPPHLAI